VVFLLVVVGGAALVVLACSGDDDGTPSTAGSATNSSSTSTTTSTSPTTSTTVDPTASMVASIAAGIREQASAITAAEADCAASELVDSVGIERLEALGEAAAGQEGVNPLALLTTEEQDAALSRMRACINPATLDQLAPGGEG
jgi:hypothetical protein